MGTENAFEVTARLVARSYEEKLAAKDAEIERLKGEAKELNDLFDRRWKRDMEAVGLWRASAPGRELSAPDRADMVTFLLDLLADKDARIAQLEEAVRVLGEAFVAVKAHARSMSDVAEKPGTPLTAPQIADIRRIADAADNAIRAVLANPVAAKAVGE